jgi:hypothetical protein
MKESDYCRARSTAPPKVKRPNAERTLSRTGTGFLNLMARGNDAPPRIMEARRLISTPYGWRFWIR